MMTNYIIGIGDNYLYHYPYGARFAAKQVYKGPNLQLARIFTSEVGAKREMSMARGKLIEIEIRIKDDEQEPAFTRDASSGRGGASSQVSAREKVLL